MVLAAEDLAQRCVQWNVSQKEEHYQLSLLKYDNHQWLSEGQIVPEGKYSDAPSP